MKEIVKSKIMVVRKRLNINGPAIVFVTTTVLDWTPVFSDIKLAKTVVNQLSEMTMRNQFSIAAYVLMPSHLHALLGLREIGQLSSTIQSFKSLSARRVRPLLTEELLSVFQQRGRFQFWRPRFDDLVVWSEKQFQIKCNYIHENPVKAGLAESPADYIFSSAKDWLLDEKGVVQIDKDWKWLQKGVAE